MTGIRLTLIGLLSAVALALSSPAAEAKGPPAATIEGGGQRVRLVMDDGRQGQLLTDLIDVTGFFGIGNVREFEKAPATLGPAYTVRYDIGGGREFVQVLYPRTSSGTMIYTPGQLYYGMRISGGWLDAPVNLTLFLHRYGIKVPTPTPTPSRAPVANVSQEGVRSWTVPTIVGSSVLVLLAACGYLVRTRRRASAH